MRLRKEDERETGAGTATPPHCLRLRSLNKVREKAVSFEIFFRFRFIGPGLGSDESSLSAVRNTVLGFVNVTAYIRVPG